MTRTEINRASVIPSLGAKESLGKLLGDLAGHSAALVKNEFELAGAELREKASGYSKGIAVLVLGMAIVLLGAGVLSAAAINALAYYVGLTNAALIVGGALLLIGLMVLWVGMKRVKEIRLRFDQSLATLEENTQWAQSQLRP